MAHQAHQAAHALGVNKMSRQTQVVTQAEHTFKIMLRELLIKQAHEVEVIGAFSAGLVVKTAARQAQGLAAGLHRTGWAGLRNQGALLGY